MCGVFYALFSYCIILARLDHEELEYRGPNFRFSITYENENVHSHVLPADGCNGPT